MSASEHVRGDATHFLLTPGHELPATEVVTERQPAFVVVAKLGEAAEGAQDSDPREP